MTRGARISVSISIVLLVCLFSRSAAAFGGFVAAKAKGEPTIESASLVLVHGDRRTVLTIAADYRGPAGDVALIVAVPQRVPARDVRVLEAGVIERLEQYTAPRMDEVWERDPCYAEPSYPIDGTGCGLGSPLRTVLFVEERPIPTTRQFVRDGHAITVLADPTGDSIAAWLRAHGYVVPPRLDAVVNGPEPGRHFVIAELSARARGPLPPLQVSYEHDGLLVPLRLGLVNPSDDPRDIVIHVIAPQHVRPLDRGFAPVPAAVVNEAAFDHFDSFYAGMLGLFGDNVAIEFIEELHPNHEITLDDLDTLGLADLRKARRWQEHGGYNREIWSVIDELVLTRMRMRVAGSVADMHLGTHASDPSSFAARTFLLHHFTGPVKCPLPRYGEHERSAPLAATTFPERVADDPVWWSYLDEPAQLDSLLVLQAPTWQVGEVSDARGSAHCAVDDRGSHPAWLLFGLMVWRYLARHARSISVSRALAVRVPRGVRLRQRTDRRRRELDHRERWRRRR